MFTIELYLYFSYGLSKILELAKARTFRGCGNCSKAGSISETESVVSATTVASGHLKMSKMEENQQLLSKMWTYNYTEAVEVNLN